MCSVGARSRTVPRMSSDVLHGLVKDLAAAEQLDEARRLVVMSTCSDQIKSDMVRRFHFQLSLDTAMEGPANAFNRGC